MANRIGMIRDGSSLSQWKHVDGKTNPADDASRGLSADNFLDNTRWIKGPEFVWQPLEEWPKQPDGLGEVSSDDLEVKRSEVITCTLVKDDLKTIDLIIKHFSLWIRLKKCIAWVLRYKRNLLEACRSRKNERLTDDNRRNVIQAITVDEMKTAERVLLKHVQNTNFSDELARCGEDVRGTNNLTQGRV